MADGEAAQSRVRVGVRVRPLSQNELAANERVALSQPSPESVSLGDDKTFTYDHVFPPHVTQQELFEQTAPPMIDAFLEGFNVTVLAYGQTGSGKTFTMGSETGCASDNQGLIPRFLTEVFRRLQGREKAPADEAGAADTHSPLHQQAQPEISVAFLEIYGEDIFDLLQPANLDVRAKSRSLQLREEQGSVSVVGLEEVAIGNTDEAMVQLRAGTLNRTTASTLMNSVSSRSHAVFMVTLHQTLPGRTPDEPGREAVSKLSFVDLAGSERLKRTGAEGQRMKEGIQINKGLLALGNVINALADEEALKRKEKVHVGYRESKLTRLLQDALGGNSQTLFLACVSPSESNSSETLSTLRYANRARNIQNKPIKNTDPVQEELLRLHHVNGVLQEELIRARFPSDGLPTGQEPVPIAQLLERQEVKDFLSELSGRLNSAMQERELPVFCPNVTQISSNTGNTNSVVSGGGGGGSGSGDGHVVRTPVRNRRLSAGRPSIMLPPTPLQVAGMAPILEIADDSLGEQECELPDPEEDVKVVDHLLELVTKEREFDKNEQERQIGMANVDAEIRHQEGLLTKIKGTLVHCQRLKEENDVLLHELQTLEGEKTQLLAQLEHQEKADHKAGASSKCVTKLRERLRMVEQRLKEQTVERKKRDQAMRLVERDSLRVKNLETNIATLKRSKADMIKKQKEAAAKHRDFVEARNLQLNKLRKSSRQEKQQMSKLVAENRKLQNAYNRQNKAHQKTEAALRRNKAHLTKLLSMNKRERLRKTISARFNKKGQVSHAGRGGAHADAGQETWAAEDDSVKGVRFCLMEMVAARVERRRAAEREEQLQGEYDALQQEIDYHVDRLAKLKDEAAYEPGGASEDKANDIVEEESKLEDVVVKLDLVSSCLADLEPVSPDGVNDDAEAREMELLSQTDAAALRPVLWSVLDELTDASLTLRSHCERMDRMQAAIDAAEQQQQVLEQQNSELRRSVRERLTVMEDERQSFAQSVVSPVGKKHGQLAALQDMNGRLEERLQQAEDDRGVLQVQAAQLREQVKQLSEELLLSRSCSRDGDHTTNTVADTLHELQSVWVDLDISADIRRGHIA